MPAPSSYRPALVQAIRRWLPAAFFSRWPLRAGLLWVPQRLAWVALLMAWSAERTLAERFAAALGLLAALLPRWRRKGGYTGWAAALRRWSGRLRPAVAGRLRAQMREAAGRHWTRGGWCAFAADGSRFDCPRTTANERALGRAGRKGTGPQLYLTALWHMGLGLPWDYRVGPGTASERRHLEGMLAELPDGALVVADAGFSGYDLYRRLLAARRSFLLRVGSNVRLLRRLGCAAREGRDTVYLWPEARRDRPPLALRLIVLRRGREAAYLLTDVRDRRALTREQAALLYELRWGVEVFYRSCKQTLQRRRMLSRTPALAEEELSWAVLGLWLLGLMTTAAVAARGGDPLCWSVALALRRLRQAARPAAAGRRRTLEAALASAVRDGYERRGGKQARDWPHKKREKRAGAPQIREATPQEVRRAQRLRQRTAAVA